LIRLVAFVKENAPRDGQLVKLRWMKLDEFFMFVLKEEIPDDMLFQQNRGPPRFNKGATLFLCRKFPEK
jgi:hypothetical protein